MRLCVVHIWPILDAYSGTYMTNPEPFYSLSILYVAQWAILNAQSLPLLANQPENPSDCWVTSFCKHVRVVMIRLGDDQASTF